MNKYKELAKLYKELAYFYKKTCKLICTHFIDADERVLEHCNDEILGQYNLDDDDMCSRIEEIERRIKELNEAIAMDEDQEIYKEAKQAANKDI